MDAVTIFAPAKVNLTLEVLGRRGDGYHEIHSVMQAVSLGDQLTFRSAPALSFECDLAGWCAERSLVTRAAALLAQESGCLEGAAVQIIKRLPLASGLGGDASDAAVVLRGLNTLWRLDLPLGRLKILAAHLGSDVPFFLNGGTAWARGRGEVLSPLPPPRKCYLVIMTPGVPRPPEKTAALYARLGAADYTSGEHTKALAERLTQGMGVDASLLYNVFEKVAYDAFPGLENCGRAMLAAGAARVHLAGAGPSLFTLHDSRDAATAICSRLAGQPVFLAETLGPAES